MKLLIAAVAFAAVTACPANWNNPCVITSSNDDLSPVSWKTCPSSQHIAQVSGEGGSHNPWWNMMWARTDFSGMPGSHFSTSCDGLGCEFMSNGIYAQQCSAICTNHPTCTAFTWQVDHGSTDGCRWGNTNDCWGNIPSSTGSQMGGGWMRGICNLYKSCSPNEYVDYRPGNGAGVKLWHLGAGDGGRCSRPGNKDLDISRKPKECNSGEELTDDGCKKCAAGTWKFGLNAEKCAPCRTCPAGEYQKETCAADADTVCFTHSEVCSNDEYQTIAPTSKNDRACATCKTCAPGSMIYYGCNRPDPWFNQKWTSDVAGNAQGALSVFQNQKIDGKPVVVHDANKNKVGCGVLEKITACPKEDPWLSQAWASDQNGAASVVATPSCVAVPIKDRVILVHDSNKNKVGCGKLTEVENGKYEATIAPLSTYGGFRALRGTFQLIQKEKEVTGTASLAGLEAGKTGVWHVHEGTSCDAPGGHLVNPQLGFKAAVTKFPSYNGDLNVAGNFFFRQSGTQLVGKYALNGLASDSSGPIHVHDGSSCESPGGHLLNDQSAAHVHNLNRRLIAAAHPGVPDEQSTGNTQCTPCLAGAGFSSKDNSAECTPLTPCAIGTYETEAGTSTTDRVCSPCTNAPANAVYTTAGSIMSNCAFKCNPGFQLTNDGTECSSTSGVPVLAFKSTTNGNKVPSKMTVYDNKVLAFEGFKCVDAPQFCGDTQLSTLAARLDLVEAQVNGVQRWARCMSDKKDFAECKF